MSQANTHYCPQCKDLLPSLGNVFGVVYTGNPPQWDEVLVCHRCRVKKTVRVRDLPYADLSWLEDYREAGTPPTVRIIDPTECVGHERRENAMPDENKLPEMVELEHIERSRTYRYSDGCALRIENVALICVRPSGSHRLETKDGKKWIIPPGWIAIEIDTDEWTF